MKYFRIDYFIAGEWIGISDLHPVSCFNIWAAGANQGAKDSLAIELCTASPYRQLKSYFATGFIIRYIRLLLIMRLAGLKEEEEDEEARMKKYHNHILYRPLSERVNVE